MVFSGDVDVDVEESFVMAAQINTPVRGVRYRGLSLHLAVFVYLFSG